MATREMIEKIPAPLESGDCNPDCPNWSVLIAEPRGPNEPPRPGCVRGWATREYLKNCRPGPDCVWGKPLEPEKIELQGTDLWYSDFEEVCSFFDKSGNEIAAVSAEVKHVFIYGYRKGFERKA